MKSVGIVATLLLLLAMLPTAYAQSVTGQVNGTLVDPDGAVIVGAPVQLTHTLSQQVRRFTTDGTGTFLFVGLVPGNYSLRIAAPGFQAYEESGLTVGTSQRLGLGSIMLEVGDVTTSITVEAMAARVATDTSDRTIDLTAMQMEDIPIRGRSYVAVIRALPGVQTLGTFDTRGWGSGAPTIQGGETGPTLLSFDGVPAQDSGAPGLSSYSAPSVDAIAEV